MLTASQRDSEHLGSPSNSKVMDIDLFQLMARKSVGCSIFAGPTNSDVSKRDSWIAGNRNRLLQLR